MRGHLCLALLLLNCTQRQRFHYRLSGIQDELLRIALLRKEGFSLFYLRTSPLPTVGCSVAALAAVDWGGSYFCSLNEPLCTQATSVLRSWNDLSTQVGVCLQKAAHSSKAASTAQGPLSQGPARHRITALAKGDPPQRALCEQTGSSSAFTPPLCLWTDVRTDFGLQQGQ